MAGTTSAVLLGSLVADAAALPTHWIYAKDALRAALQAAPVFGPVKSTWHPLKSTGELSMYGEGGLVLAASLAAAKAWAPADYRDRFMAAFGPGGTYVGYVDGATKSTVFNVMKLGVDNAAALRPGPGVSPAVMKAAYPVLGPAGKGAPSEAAAADAGEAKAREAAAAATGGAALDDATLAWARAHAAAQWRIANAPAGAADDQSNAFGKLPLAAAFAAGTPGFAATLEGVVRATQNHDDAVAWMLPAARMVEAAVSAGAAGSPRAAVDAGLAALDAAAAAGDAKAATIAGKLREAVALAEAEAAAPPADVLDACWAAGSRFGNSCPLPSTLPLVVYALLRRGDGVAYADAVRDAIACGGETAARAALVGGVLAALGRAPPAEWVAQLAPGVRSRLDALAPGVEAARAAAVVA